MKLLTLEDYRMQEKHSAKVLVCCQRTWEDAKPEQVLKVMEAVGGVALKLALEKKEGPFGFNKKEDDSN